VCLAVILTRCFFRSCWVCCIDAIGKGWRKDEVRERKNILREFITLRKRCDCRLKVRWNYKKSAIRCRSDIFFVNINRTFPPLVYLIYAYYFSVLTSNLFRWHLFRSVRFVHFIFNRYFKVYRNTKIFE